MGKAARKPWEKYAVNTTSLEGSGSFSGARKLNTVSHVAHIETAIHILKDKKIKPGLVFDMSKLNKERILVSWASPNGWASGFRYGSVKFEFDFRRLARRKRYYWVEAITEYSPPACRILVTDQDRSGNPLLVEYNPETDNGPWHYDKKKKLDYFNENICLEFMFEAELDVTEISHFSFVNHHQSMCSIHRKNIRLCRERKWENYQAGAMFLASAISQAMDLRNLSKFLMDRDGEIENSVHQALFYLGHKMVDQIDSLSGRLNTDDERRYIARAALNALANNRTSELETLLDLFSRKSELLRAIADLVEEFFGLNSSTVYKILRR